jgi:hypothetical protein
METTSVAARLRRYCTVNECMERGGLTPWHYFEVSGELHPPVVLFHKCVWYKLVSKLPRPQKKFELGPGGRVPLNRCFRTGL